MTTASLHPPLPGRDRECAHLEQVVAAARAGESRVLVLHGEAGIGKTALLGHLEQCAQDVTVLRTAGVEADMELAYAGLQQLCAPLLGHLTAVPAPQADALSIAFGLKAGPAPDRFLVGLAVLGMMAAAAAARPLLCLVDDAQWADRVTVQTLSFVARRLLAEPVALVFATREIPAELTGLPELAVRGLADADARRLLDAATPGRLDAQVRDRIVAETHGNPLALLELPRDLSASQLAGGYYRPDAAPMAGQLENHFTGRIRALPDDARRVLTLAAAEPLGDTTLLIRAAGHLGLTPGAATAAQRDGLLDIDSRVRFRHPLVRSAAYRAADPDMRRAAHRALADVTDSTLDPDRRAWHRAHAAFGPDESVAADLERSADRAAQRGGSAAAAAFLTRAVELTPDPRTRGQRALSAAEALCASAGPDGAEQMLTVADAAPLDDLGRARLERLRAQVTFARGRAGDHAPTLLASVTRLTDIAHRLDALDSGLAAETHLDALSAAMYVGRLGDPDLLRRIAEAARAASRRTGVPRPVDLVVDALATRILDGCAAASGAMRAAVDALGPQNWLWQAYPLAHEVLANELWDAEAGRRLADTAVRLATESGSLAVLPKALVSRAGAHVLAGELTAARSLLAKADELSVAAGHGPVRYHQLTMAGWIGEEAQATPVIEAALRDGADRGEGRILGLAGYATAVLHNGLGRYQVALAAARTACEFEDLSLYTRTLIELVEAAVRAGEPDAAAAAFEQVNARLRPAGADWALGVLARVQAMVTVGAAAERYYREAVDRLGRTPIAIDHARARLLYGEWLRRENRRSDARTELRSAHEDFVVIGAKAFADRARRELLATGEKAAKRPTRSGDALTPQEQQIAELAGAGLTNPEIGAQLFISAHTVEWHLRKVFAKLGIRSRRELRDAPWR
ncbi:LuxR family transcriptional regulator [Mycobacterium sp. PS03-16]|uniref:helix-turn-helix transcriptional regulator n=1 Tax=Mycobacterium sp. PS03-16 TaxID=2559611 RepID=UPI001073F6EC|nr:LuxR family transcriptional regulator [Mycobacterium sp. PS03-16]TFV60352.1 LuxR family transcriptional regulator [Mycobacterium sp. PS03-16]